MTENFELDNDYTISATVEKETSRRGENTDDKVYYVSTLTRTFNFLSAQVTTVKCDRIFQSRGSGGGSSSVSTQMVVENFRDIQSTAEIELMHAKLAELGGKPPALDGMLTRLNKNRLD